MTNAKIESGTLTANLEERTLSGLLVPFGELGNTNLGRFTVEAGALKLPRDPSVVTLNSDHDRENPIGRATELLEAEDGIRAVFKFADTDEADEALLAYESGAKSALSVEAKNMVIRAGKAVSGTIFGAAHVLKGAFPGASLLAADAGDTVEVITDEYTGTDGVTHKRTTTRTTKVEGDKTTITETVVIEEPEATAEAIDESLAATDKNKESKPKMVDANVPNTLEAASKVANKQPTKHEIFGILSAIKAGRADATMLARLEEFSGVPEASLFAALNDVKITGTGNVGNQLLPQWIDELWSGVAYKQQIVPLFNHADLSGITINGFRWTTKPTGGTWAGDKANVPSNTPVTSPYTTTAKRFAGGHDIAREFRDFNVEGFFESYYAAMAESYAKWVDETVVLTDVLAGATAVEADNPAGLTIGAGLSAVIDGAATVIANGAVPSFALVAPELYKSILKTPDNATLGYLSAALGLEDGNLAGFTLRPSALVPTGNVLVGAKEAATVYELPGSPIRVEAPDMIKGGIDTGVFGYAGTVINKADALIKVTPYTP